MLLRNDVILQCMLILTMSFCSTYWYFPDRKSLVDKVVPLVRESFPTTKIIVMGDVLLAPDGHGLLDDGYDDDDDESAEKEDSVSERIGTYGANVSNKAEEFPQFQGAAGAQMMGFAAADAVGVETDEDGRSVWFVLLS